MSDQDLDLGPLRRAADALERALDVLAEHEGAKEERLLLRDGVIQRFEIAFELSWKTLRRYLRVYGLSRVEHMTNRELFRQGQVQGVIRDAEAWFTFLRHRNLTSHVYNETIAEEVFSSAAPLLAELRYLIASMAERSA